MNAAQMEAKEIRKLKKLQTILEKKDLIASGALTMWMRYNPKTENWDMSQEIGLATDFKRKFQQYKIAQREVDACEGRRQEYENQQIREVNE